MPLLVGGEALTARRAVTAGPLAALADALAEQLEPLVARGPFIPTEKALLSREGGRCAVDGSLLAFDPWSPHAHRCPLCDRVYTGVRHDRFWLYWYQLWLAERALHAALLHALRGDPRHAALAREILAGYAEQYLRYPNRDNVLGPGRVFFSTYLESIWLLQLALALDLLEASGGVDATLGARVRERILEPSSVLIASYDEGGSNRQVWNDAALLAAGALLGRPEMTARAVHGVSGVAAQIERGLLADGSWYEGENYHLFAHRGLWYGVTMSERLGLALPDALVRRFDAGFAASFATSLPDLTLPSRRDSQYAISIRQPRFAELCELALARGDDARCAALLHALYDPTIPRGDTGQPRTTADVERNLPATGLARADLGWRTLLFARPELPCAERLTLGSVLMEGQGIAVLRRERGDVYVALDYGHHGGGHGHPDRLNLLLSDGATRWLDDMGTGSYVERVLHWYRSTLAHNAPLAGDRSQQRVAGRLLAYDERGGAGWVMAEAEIATGVRATRTLVAMPDYLLDELRWAAPHHTTLSLPYHLDGETMGAHEWLAAKPEQGGGEEDGFDFTHAAERMRVGAGDTVHLVNDTPPCCALWLSSRDTFEWWRLVAPGAPGQGERRFHLARMHGMRGELRAVIAWRGTVRDVRADATSVEVALADGTRQLHRRTGEGWMVELEAAGARSSIALEGVRELDESPAAPSAETSLPVAAIPDLTLRAASGLEGASAVSPPRDERLVEIELAERHYIRSEQSWHEAGEPRARLTIGWSGRELHLWLDVQLAVSPRFVAADAINPYDNEPADINGDGVQLYLVDGRGRAAWMLVPEPGGDAVRVRTIAGWNDRPLTARWQPTGTGYRLHAIIPLEEPSTHVALDVIVNETAPDRERRRGQLALSGGGGFVYLRGDRQEVERLVTITLVE